ncbi:hypothetical protein E2562_005020 [Oryza meyeriana var. granulata]|uniref:Uncharacterized protein n=1 Tax=Oryza meyeriana var. granulata TaxID=110450 RepID=A0A6G1BR68_9ORYZ|nr:hypothetical protein E2562_005020 [Oryza meyeriana var. granulata]
MSSIRDSTSCYSAIWISPCVSRRRADGAMCVHWASARHKGRRSGCRPRAPGRLAGSQVERRRGENERWEAPLRRQGVGVVEGRGGGLAGWSGEVE